MPTDDPLPFSSAESWRQWLHDNHADSAGLWLKLARADSGIDSVTYPQALDVALCYGWIDGQKRAMDEQYWLQRFTPRRRGSKWSKVNCAKALALIEAGLMQPAGQREVDAAQADGRWAAAYDSPKTMGVPDDLRAALDQRPRAKEMFEAANSRNRYAILYRVQDAKKPETRARRIDKLVDMLDEGKYLYP